MNKFSSGVRRMTATAALAAAMVSGGFASPAHALNAGFGDLVVGIFGNSQEYFKVLGSANDLLSGPKQSFNLSGALANLQGTNALRYSLFTMYEDGTQKTSSSKEIGQFSQDELNGVAPSFAFNAGALWFGQAGSQLGGTTDVQVAATDPMSFTSVFTNTGSMAGGFPVAQEGPLGSLLHMIKTDALTGGAPMGMGQAMLGEDGILMVGQSVAAVPLPAAVWLFGTGLIGLAGMARRSSKINA